MRPSRRSATDLILHLHPPQVPVATLRFTLSWGLGGMAAVLIGLLFMTGVLLLLVYQASTEHAYDSVQVLTREVPFGAWVRNIHYWSANLLIAAALLHLLRVVLTGAFSTGRRLNWVIGLGLLFLVLAANFTGYLLPWDQLSYWAVTICTSMLDYIPLCGDWLKELVRGGAAIGPGTLANFFVLHVAAIPAALVFFMAWHFWLVRRAGGLVAKGEVENVRVATVPHLLVREAAVGLGVVACTLLFAIFYNAPLLEQANPGMSPNPSKAPWYFQGFQELLLHLHPVFAVTVWPLAATALVLAVPFWNGSALPPGNWFGGKQGRGLAVWSAVAGMALTAGWIVGDTLLAGTGNVGANGWLHRGAIPTACLGLLLGSGYALLVRTLRRTRAEAVMACFVFALGMLAVLTVAGIWFRGPEMRLIWPWMQGGV